MSTTPAGFAIKLRGAAKDAPTALLAELYRQAEQIMTVSKTDYVPVDTGALRASGFVDLPIVTAGGGYVELGFGGPSAPYALIVHEDLTKRHPVGQAKYLSIPVIAALQGMQAVLRQRTSDAIKQAFQRLGKVEANVLAGRDVNWGMPLYRGTPG
jgi:hypothetical protein